MRNASISMLVFFNWDMTVIVGSMLNVNADNRTWMEIGIEDEVLRGYGNLLFVGLWSLGDPQH